MNDTELHLCPVLIDVSKEKNPKYGYQTESKGHIDRQIIIK